MGVCVGPGFVVNTDGSLGLNGPRSGSWPYGTTGSCQISAANGFRVDTATGNLWVEPPDIRVVQNSGGQSVTSVGVTTTPQLFGGLTAMSVTNPDPCRPSLIFGTFSIQFAFNFAANQTITVRGGVYNGTPPAPASLPAVWSETSQGGVATLDTQDMITVPYAFTIAAGATANITASFAFSGSVAGGTTTNNTWTYAGVSLTQRTSW